MQFLSKRELQSQPRARSYDGDLYLSLSLSLSLSYGHNCRGAAAAATASIALLSPPNVQNVARELVILVAITLKQSFTAKTYVFSGHT